jgi:hypothetical protein
MGEIEPFNVFRRALLVVGLTYTLVQLIHIYGRWAAWGVGAARHELLLRRWMIVTLLNIRLRRFTLELLEIGVLAMILAVLIWMQL